MALISCRECSKDISDEAKTCPNCGAKVKKPIGKFGIVVAILATIFMVKCSLTSHENSPAKTDPVEEARFLKTSIIAATIKKSMRDPESITWETLLANSDASVVCAEYRARNGFGGMSREITVLANGKSSNKIETWNKYCTEKMFNMIYVKNALR